MDERVQVKDRVYVVRDGKQVYGRVAAVEGDKAIVTTYKGDDGTVHSLGEVIVSHRYVPQPPPVVRVDLLPAQRSSQNR